MATLLGRVFVAKSKTSRIREAAIRIIADHPEGIQYSDLRRRIHETDSSLKLTTIGGAIFDLDARVDEVEKPSRGLFRMRVTDAEGNAIVPPLTPTIQEEQFYSPFADWLKNGLEDVTKAIRWAATGSGTNGERRTSLGNGTQGRVTLSSSRSRSCRRRSRRIRVSSSRPSDRRAPIVFSATGRIWWFLGRRPLTSYRG